MVLNIDRTFISKASSQSFSEHSNKLPLWTNPAQLKSTSGFASFTQSNIDFSSLTSKYDVPKNLQQLIQGNQNAFLALKIVEIIGEDEVNNLDPETIYFITNLLNKLNLKQFRNEILGTALPLRI